MAVRNKDKEKEQEKKNQIIQRQDERLQTKDPELCGRRKFLNREREKIREILQSGPKTPAGKIQVRELGRFIMYIV